ncbi:MAG: hypothetical protein AAGJ79_05400 [Verrucomicrobiota bacterium]
MPTKKEILDLYFMDARCKLIDLAAFLDRVDRHEGAADFRHPAFMKALASMQEPPSGKSRAQAVLESLSDHSDEPVEAATIQFAYGAPIDSQ